MGLIDEVVGPQVQAEDPPVEAQGVEGANGDTGAESARESAREAGREAAREVARETAQSRPQFVVLPQAATLRVPKKAPGPAPAPKGSAGVIQRLLQSGSEKLEI